MSSRQYRILYFGSSSPARQGKVDDLAMARRAYTTADTFCLLFLRSWAIVVLSLGAIASKNEPDSLSLHFDF